MLNIIPSISKISVVGIYNCASALFINVHIHSEEYAPKMRAKGIWGRKDSYFNAIIDLKMYVYISYLYNMHHIVSED